MSETRHTPGPWHWVNPSTDEPATDREIAGQSEVSLRTVEEFPASYCGPLPKFVIWSAELHGDEALSDAHLIAAAPDLLAALEFFACPSTTDPATWMKAHQAARAAIRLAETGERT